MSKPKMMKVTVEDLTKKCKPQKIIIEDEEAKTETILVKCLAEKPELQRIKVKPKKVKKL
jgi:hypothetical protein